MRAVREKKIPGAAASTSAGFLSGLNTARDKEEPLLTLNVGKKLKAPRGPMAKHCSG